MKKKIKNKFNPFKTKTQLDLPLGKGLHVPITKDRNHESGGRSFYFFDFDDNVVHLPTEIFLFNKTTGEEKCMSTVEFSTVQLELGLPGPWEDFEIRLDDQTGTFRRFREKKHKVWQKSFRKTAKAFFKKLPQPLEEDLEKVFQLPFDEWKGPSWEFFRYACLNQRPVSIITARGHNPDTLKRAIKILKEKGYITHEPNYLSVYPVSYKPTRLLLGDSKLDMHASKLKQEAIKLSVKEAFRVYGQNDGHRFGMSDDDPINLRLIMDVMRDLKKEYPKNSFFVIDTHGGKLMKQEIFVDHTVLQGMKAEKQLSFFGE